MTGKDFIKRIIKAYEMFTNKLKVRETQISKT